MSWLYRNPTVDAQKHVVPRCWNQANSTQEANETPRDDSRVNRWQILASSWRTQCAFVWRRTAHRARRRESINTSSSWCLHVRGVATMTGLPQPPREPERPSYAMRTILIVDDSPTIRRMIKARSAPCGRDVYRGDVGSSGDRGAGGSALDMAILRSQHARMHGLDVLRFIRSHDHYKDVPVMILTTRGDGRPATGRSRRARRLT